jgi:hypothetical protein
MKKGKGNIVHKRQMINMCFFWTNWKEKGGLPGGEK